MADQADFYRLGFDEGYDPQLGGFTGRSTLTPTVSKTNTVAIEPPGYAVPIILVPGIMGSNLRASREIKDANDRPIVKQGDSVWRVDSTFSFGLDWLTRKKADYQLRLQHDMVEVDPGGDIDGAGFWIFERDYTPLARLKLDVARDQRHWGEVSAAFYGELLDWMESIFNQSYVMPDTKQDNPNLGNIKQEWAQPPLAPLGREPIAALDEATIKRLLKVRNPVYACGYNWLDDNAKSAQRLAQRIEEVFKANNHECSRCEQVILVTHSMGGLVARHAVTQIPGIADKVAGVFHCVMPTDGAAATYKRLVAGFGGEGGGVSGWLGAQALGPTGDYVTASMPLNPGPLQLLPNARYNGGKPWLFVQHGQGEQATTSVALPKTDPYEEIYLDEQHWWRATNAHWMNPASMKFASDPFFTYAGHLGKAKQFHTKVQNAGDFHANTHAYYAQARPAYATVTWSLDEADSAQWPDLQRANANDADMHIGLKQAQPPAQTDAHLSTMDAPGDGTVPSEASAAQVAEGVRARNVLMIDTNPAIEHGAVFEVKHGAEPLRALFHAVTHSVMENLNQA